MLRAWRSMAGAISVPPPRSPSAARRIGGRARTWSDLGNRQVVIGSVQTITRQRGDVLVGGAHLGGTADFHHNFSGIVRQFGAFILARAGLLKGRKATTHRGLKGMWPMRPLNMYLSAR